MSDWTQDEVYKATKTVCVEVGKYTGPEKLEQFYDAMLEIALRLHRAEQQRDQARELLERAVEVLTFWGATDGLCEDVCKFLAPPAADAKEGR